MKDTIKNLFSRNWTKTEKCLFAADVLLLGVLIGWITSPLKADRKGWIFKNYTLQEEDAEDIFEEEM